MKDIREFFVRCGWNSPQGTLVFLRYWETWRAEVREGKNKKCNCTKWCARKVQKIKLCTMENTLHKLKGSKFSRIGRPLPPKVDTGG